MFLILVTCRHTCSNPQETRGSQEEQFIMLQRPLLDGHQECPGTDSGRGQTRTRVSSSKPVYHRALMRKQNKMAVNHFQIMAMVIRRSAAAGPELGPNKTILWVLTNNRTGVTLI